MTRSLRTRRLVEVALAIRRARRSVTDDRARSQLLRAEFRLRTELGGAVPKSVAARVVGVSLTGLERWVDAGRLPIVRRPGGREELAAEALLDVAEEVELLRGAGASRALLVEALRRLERRGLPRPRPRPNESAEELRRAYEQTTPVQRLRETAELSLAATTLAEHGARRRSSPTT